VLLGKFEDIFLLFCVHFLNTFIYVSNYLLNMQFAKVDYIQRNVWQS